MLQQTHSSLHTGTELQSLPDAHTTDDSLGLADTLKLVACPVCRAMYVPTEQPPFGSTGLLEAAFLGVCRFCFRCQRPSCPQCWNPVHHTCACCSEEANLPFRAPVPSLEGLVFMPSTTLHPKKEHAISFTCQRNGRFYMPEMTPEHLLRQGTMLPASSGKAVLEILPDVPPSQTSNTSDQEYPAWLQEVLGQKGAEQSAIATSTEQSATHLTSMPASFQASEAYPQAAQETWFPPVAPAQPQTLSSEMPRLSPSVQRAFSPTSPALVAEYPGGIIYQDDPGSDDISLFERIENILIIITSILLLAVVLMIVLSIVSPQVNAFFLHLFHIDIRTEIAYLLQLR